jgi:hypothetical protein
MWRRDGLLEQAAQGRPPKRRSAYPIHRLTAAVSRPAFYECRHARETQIPMSWWSDPE